MMIMMTKIINSQRVFKTIGIINYILQKSKKVKIIYITLNYKICYKRIIIRIKKVKYKKALIN